MHKKFQITCRCTAYKFPHRLGSGKCSGDQWCGSYSLFVKDGCDTCNCYVDNICQVSLQQESITQCNAVETILDQQLDVIKLPITEDEYYNQFLQSRTYSTCDF